MHFGDFPLLNTANSCSAEFYISLSLGKILVSSIEVIVMFLLELKDDMFLCVVAMPYDPKDNDTHYKSNVELQKIHWCQSKYLLIPEGFTFLEI